MKRVFLGINLNEELRSKIEDLKKKYGLLNLPMKIVEPENSHIVIKFLNKLNDEQIKLLVQLIKDGISSFKSFEINIKDILVFPNLSKPRVLALKVISPNLEGLAKKLFASFSELDFIINEERKYTPHITLGRFKGNLSEQETKKISNMQFEDNFMVNEIHLFESELTTSGPVYNILETFELK